MLIKLSKMKKICNVCHAIETDTQTDYCENCNNELTKIGRIKSNGKLNSKEIKFIINGD